MTHDLTLLKSERDSYNCTAMLEIIRPQAKVVPFQVDPLLEKLAAGEPAAFKAIYNRYRPKLLRYLLAMLPGEQHLAEDLVQDLFLACWKKRETLAGIHSLENYLFIMARNRLINERIKRKTRREKITKIDHRAAATLCDIHEHLETKWTLAEAVNALPSRIRKVYLLKEAGLNVRQVGSVMGISPFTVKNQYGQAIKKLKVAFAAAAT